MWGQRLAVFTWNNNFDTKNLIFKTSAVGWRKKFFTMSQKPLVGQGHHFIEALRSH